MSDPQNPGTSARSQLAYREEAFLQSPDSRPLRLLSEYLRPLSHFHDENVQDTIEFFGSAGIWRRRRLVRYCAEARQLATHSPAAPKA